MKGIIAIEFVGRALELIGARLRHQVDLPARSLAELGRIVAGLDLEFLKNVDRGPEVEQIIKLITVDGAVQQKAVLFRPRPGDRDAAAGRRCAGIIAGIHAWQQRRQLDKVSAVEQQIDNLLLIHHRTD